MASQLATGAVHLFVRGFGLGQPVYFGTCERMPNDTRNPEYEPVYNDITGTKVPLDFAWEGETSMIQAPMTRWTESVAQLLETKIRGGGGGGVPGSWLVTDVGALMSLEGLSFELWTAYTFGAALANKTPYTSLGLMPGRHYLQCVVWAPESEDKGTKAMTRNFMFYSWPKLVTSGGSGLIGAKFFLYDQDFSQTNFASLIS